MAASTASRTEGVTGAEPLMTRDTVAGETPATAATVASVGGRGGDAAVLAFTGHPSSPGIRHRFVKYARPGSGRVPDPARCDHGGRPLLSESAFRICPIEAFLCTEAHLWRG